MSTLNFKDWLLHLEMGTPGAPQTPTGVPDPNIAMAQQNVKAKLAKPQPGKPLADQAREALAQAATNAPNPMKVAQLDQGDAAAAGPNGQPSMMRKK